MEAPEKIYLVKDRDTNKPMDYWYSATTDDSRIEYTRTDAFIEKVCKFLDDRIKHDSIDYPMATPHLIDDVKNYMKGE
jgi:hypothetical protein